MKAFDYFKELNKIPRGSFNEKQVANYLCDFAKKMGLKYKIDDLFNVKIFKDNGSDKTIILQAHMDMVCEKLKGVNFDFEKEAIKTIIDGDFIRADGTTLGGDDGFGVSLILEMLEECGEGFPNIEAVFTSQEESGMGGAKFIDTGDLSGKFLLGLDGTSSNELIISSAGSCRLDFEKKFYGENIKIDNADCECKGKNAGEECLNSKEEGIGETQENCNYNLFKLEVLGLLGGHSGEDIDKGRANANVVGFEILGNLAKQPLKIVEINGGGKDNAIPREFTAVFESALSLKEIESVLNEYNQLFANNFPNEINATFSIQTSENNLNLFNQFENCSNQKDCSNVSCLALSETDSKNLIDFITHFPNGVIEKTAESGQVICSINLANVQVKNAQFISRTMLRFNTTKAQSDALNEFTLYSNSKNYKCILRDSAPFFEASVKHDLIDIAVKSYEQCGFTNLNVMQIHAGLEGGIFAEKIPNLQVVVLGADLYDIHTPQEKMRISSLTKLSNWIKQIMLNM